MEETGLPKGFVFHTILLEDIFLEDQATNDEPMYLHT